MLPVVALAFLPATPFSSCFSCVGMASRPVGCLCAFFDIGFGQFSTKVFQGFQGLRTGFSVNGMSVSVLIPLEK